MAQSVLFCDIKPYVRYGHINTMTYIGPWWAQHTICARDHRLIYVLHGEGDLVIEGKTYPLFPTVGAMWRAGTRYRICPKQNTKLVVVMVNFDFTDQSGRWPKPLPIVESHKFTKDLLLEDVIISDVGVLNRPIYLQNLSEIEMFMLQMANEYTSGMNMYETVARGCLISVLGILARQGMSPGFKDNSDTADGIIEYLQNNYSKPLSGRQLAERFHYHPNYINRLLKLKTGLTTHQYLMRHRIKQGLILIQTTNSPVEEIARMVGFKDASHFSACFKRLMGKSPSEFRTK